MRNTLVRSTRKMAAALLALTLFSCGREQKTQEKSTAPITQADTSTAARVPVTPPAKTPEPRLSTAELSMQRAGLVDVQSLDSTILVELKYSTTDNFVGVDVYGELTRAYLQKMPAQKLLKAQTYLRKEHPGYHLLIYDAGRPRHVQQILWDTLKKPEKIRQLYVADPRKGSIHNYGAAVDLTIADEKGQALDMGTPFDYFGVMAYPTKEDSLLNAGKLTAQQVENRKLLRRVMRQAGFSPIESEWWHFNATSLARCKEIYQIVE